jgi:phosphoglycolate phosphatase
VCDRFLSVGFDLDLTLVDSHDRIISAFIRALRDLGVEVSSEDLGAHLGGPLTQTAATVAPAIADADALVVPYRHYYDEPGAPRALAIPGATDALRCVRDAGGRIVVVSAKFTPAVHAALKQTGLTGFVDVVYGAVLAEDKSTALIAEGASIDVGDHPGDMAAADVANACAVGVTTGAIDEAVLARAGAEVALTDLYPFEPWLSARGGGIGGVELDVPKGSMRVHGPDVPA